MLPRPNWRVFTLGQHELSVEGRHLVNNNIKERLASLLERMACGAYFVAATRDVGLVKGAPVT